MPWSPGRQSASCLEWGTSETVSTPSYTHSSDYQHLEDFGLLQWAAAISWLAALRHWSELSVAHFQNAPACFQLV
jgi:hypothetical protein